MKAKTFTWLDEKLDRRQNEKFHYWAFQHGGLQIRCGDYVLIRNDKSANPESIHCCFVAQVKDLYENSTENSYKAVVQWYSRIADLPPKHQLLLPTVDCQQELVLDYHKRSTDVHAETIFGKCSVILLSPNVPSELYLDAVDSNGNPMFYCKWRYNESDFQPVSTSNNSTNTSVQESIPCNTTETTEKKALIRHSSINSFSSDEDESKQSSENELIASQGIGDTYTCLKTGSSVSPMKKRKINRRAADLSNCTKSLNGSRKTELECELPSHDYKYEDSELHTPLLDINSDLHQQQTVSPIKLKLPLYTSLENKQKNENLTKFPLKFCSPRYKNDFIIIPPIYALSTKCLNAMMTCTVKLNSLDLSQKSALLLDNNLKTVDKNKYRATSRSLFMNSPKKSEPIQERRSRRKIYPVKAFEIDWKNGQESNQELSELSSTEDENSKLISEDNECHKTPLKHRKKSQKRLFRKKRGESINGNSVWRNFKQTATNKNSYCSKLAKKQKSKPATSKSQQSDGPSFTIPSRDGSLMKPRNSIEEAREKLHAAVVPDSLPCREHQFLDIYAFIKGKLLDRTGGCMYISGVPGTGKTATVLDVVRTLKNEQDSGILPKFHFVEINGMRMTEPHQCYVQILKALTGQKAKPEYAAELLQKYFTGKNSRKDTVLIMIDELDLLWTRKQTVMYNLFDWPSYSTSKLIVVAIANTMDLPERIMMNRVVSRLGLTRMTFQPYTYKQLEEIIVSRMKTMQFSNPFDPDAVQLVARKVAAISGDARRVLDICRRATEIAEEGAVKQSPRKGYIYLIGLVHMEKALQEMFSSPMIIAMRSASLHEKVFLKSIVAEFQRTGVEETTFACAFKQHISYCRFEGIPQPTTSEVARICMRLGSCHLLLLENGYCDMHQRIRLNVSTDDVRYALTDT